MTKDEKIKTVFMGTPDFAVPVLSALAGDPRFETGYVVTQTDKARNRGKKVLPTPVKARAEELGIPVLQPERVKGNEELFATLKAYAPDVIVVAAYGKILPKELLELPRAGCVNVHASLLPRHRGAAPIERVILDGDERAGVTLMMMEEGLDTGDMLASASVPAAGKTADDLRDELSRLGAGLLMDKLGDICDGTVPREKQDDALFTYAPMLSKQDALLDFSEGAEAAERKVRAMYSRPGAFTYLAGEPVKIWRADVTGEKTAAADGTVTDVSDGGIKIAAGGGIINVTEIQMPGKKRMAVRDFLRGNNIEKGTVLG